MPAETASKLVLKMCRDPDGSAVSKDKLSRNAIPILAGLILGSWFNGLSWAVAPSETNLLKQAFSG
jgi:hypothetical protein